MIFQRKLFAAFAVLGLVGFLAGGPAWAEGTVVAKVGSVPITIYELQRAQNELMPMAVSFHGGLSQEKLTEIRELAMENLIERAYKVQYAIAEEIAVDNTVVENAMAKLREGFKSDKEFKAAAGTEGLPAVRASLYRDALARKAEEVVVDAKVTVSDEQVRDAYEKSIHSYKRPKQYKVSHILIKVDPASNKEEREALRQKAEDLVKKAKAGEDFYNLAYYNSDDRSKFVGGSIKPFHEGQTEGPFNDAVIKMKPGEVSDLVQTRYGYHIIKLEEVIEAHQLSFEDVKSNVRAKLEKSMRDSLYEQWMSDLKSKYKVQRFDN